ncbi:MAG: hypothetical protein WCL43_07060, partial [Chlorobium sp.]
ITDSMLQRKRDAINGVMQDVMRNDKKAVILTNCPSCIQGLGRNLDLGIQPQHIVVELAELQSKKGWMDIMRNQVSKGKVATF